MTNKLIITAVTMLVLALWASGLTSPGITAAHADDAAGGAKLVERLKALRPDIPIEKVTDTPLPGIYALELSGGTVFYGTEDGRYLFAGDLYELGDRDLVNLADVGRASKRRELLATASVDDMIVFPASTERKAAITVFTDVDCGYCRKLHQEMAELNALGIEVRYMAYPRAGIGSPSYAKIVSAWCAEDPNSAITKLKLGETIPDASCENPVAAQYELGRAVGVTGTPAILLEDGRLLPGYMPAPDLAAAIGI